MQVTVYKLFVHNDLPSSVEGGTSRGGGTGGLSGHRWDKCSSPRDVSQDLTCKMYVDIQ